MEFIKVTFPPDSNIVAPYGQQRLKKRVSEKRSEWKARKGCSLFFLCVEEDIHDLNNCRFQVQETPFWRFHTLLLRREIIRIVVVTSPLLAIESPITSLLSLYLDIRPLDGGAELPKRRRLDKVFSHYSGVANRAPACTSTNTDPSELVISSTRLPSRIIYVSVRKTIDSRWPSTQDTPD